MKMVFKPKKKSKKEEIEDEDFDEEGEEDEDLPEIEQNKVNNSEQNSISKEEIRDLIEGHLTRSLRLIQHLP